jgi:hypothetical protein
MGVEVVAVLIILIQVLLAVREVVVQEVLVLLVP